MFRAVSWVLSGALLITSLPSASVRAADLTPDEIRAIAQEAYLYLYPLVIMDVSRRQFTNIEAGKMPGRGPMNAFSHMREYPAANFREVVRPNFDTLYSSAWLDLSEEPMIVTVPDTDGRYYLLPMLDMWTDVFAVPGKRTSGTKAAKYAIIGPGWDGTLPDDVEPIEAPTPYVWILGRTQTNGPADYAAVHKVQDGYTITPLSHWGKKDHKPPTAKIDPNVDMKTPPLEQLNAMPAAKFFAYGLDLMAVNPPHLSDWSQIARMRRIGLEPGEPLDFDKLPAEVKQALNQAPAASLQTMKTKLPVMGRMVNGWSMITDTMGVYGDYYLKRAIVALMGLGANQCDDAIYPLCVGDAEGKPLMGGNKYLLHFPKEQLPPVDAFWSVTMYDAEGYQVANALNRFAIGDRDALKYNADGSLDLYLQHESPGSDKESNWLPSPAQGVLGVTMRLYAPKPSALEQGWNPPAVQHVR